MFYRDFEDTRACTPRACTPTGKSSCFAFVSAYTEEDCSPRAPALTGHPALPLPVLHQAT
ncbi:hypothetical protein [Sorangium cellulosum]|uniref:Uncharacterized protein n=1 Tax=Sorangium cellulosum TaxID=56 RepID=A0A150QD03_SORCE|nr:hypothetical protein [Sorangium cellulosum]KYF65528.1 hypothetical protein BE15_45505 [Sorangium cellulosum]